MYRTRFRHIFSRVPLFILLFCILTILNTLHYRYVLLDELVNHWVRRPLNIDAVYTWVNGSDPEWRTMRAYWQFSTNSTEQDVIDDSRFVEHSELKYSLRSLSQNAPWIHRIFIVTNGQRPGWLNLSHPKIQLIRHDEIMPASSLPTFNSEAIEANLGNIPGLSELFIYSNDDTFINSPISPTYFFRKDGKAFVVPGTRYMNKKHVQRNFYFRNIYFSSQLVKARYGKEFRFEPSHNIKSFRTDSFRACMQAFFAEYNMTTYRRFRDRDSVQVALVSYYSLLHGAALYRPSRLEEQRYYKLVDHSTLFSQIRRDKPKLFCINDDNLSAPKDRQGLPLLLQKLFPSPAEWELAE